MMKTAIAVLAVTLGAGSALAAETQPYDPSVKLYAYEGQVENFCPAGTQPVRYDGMISCGVPDATGYVDAPVVRRNYAAPVAAVNTTSPKSPSYQPETISMSGS